MADSNNLVAHLGAEHSLLTGSWGQREVRRPHLLSFPSCWLRHGSKKSRRGQADRRLWVSCWEVLVPSRFLAVLWTRAGGFCLGRSSDADPGSTGIIEEPTGSSWFMMSPVPSPLSMSNGGFTKLTRTVMMYAEY